MPRPHTVLAVVLAVLAVGCSSDPTDLDASPSPLPSTAPGEAVPDGASSPDASPAPAAELAAYVDAVKRTQDAMRRTFVGQVRAAAPDGVVVIDLEGSRDGDRRTLALRTDGGEVSFEITPDGATADSGSGPRPVALEEVPAAPGLAQLQDLEGLEFERPGVARGTLSQVAGVPGASSTGRVTVTVEYEPGGVVQQLVLEGPDGGYRATVVFSDVQR